MKNEEYQKYFAIFENYIKKMSMKPPIKFYNHLDSDGSLEGNMLAKNNIINSEIEILERYKDYRDLLFIVNHFEQKKQSFSFTINSLISCLEFMVKKDLEEYIKSFSPSSEFKPFIKQETLDLKRFIVNLDSENQEISEAFIFSLRYFCLGKLKEMKEFVKESLKTEKLLDEILKDDDHI